MYNDFLFKIINESRDMKAVILCAGTGKRLFPLTKDKPKCLLKFGERTILERIIDDLKACGTEELFLVVGFHRERIEHLVEVRGYDGIRFVVNERYASTNTAFSLNLALKHMDSDFILINGDMLFDGEILEDLIRHPEKNCVVVDNTKASHEEEVKVTVSDNRIKDISKEIDPDCCAGEAIGINKISAEAVRELSLIFTELEQKQEYQHFFEKGIEEFCANHGRFGFLLTERPWVEIDCPADFEYAQGEIYAKLDA